MDDLLLLKLDENHEQKRTIYEDLVARRLFKLFLTAFLNNKAQIYYITTLSKISLKKLILDLCNKTAYSFNNAIFEQTNGVFMGSALLGPVAPTQFTTLTNLTGLKNIPNLLLKHYLMGVIRFLNILTFRQMLTTDLHAY